MYIYQRKNWPHFYWNKELITPTLVAVRHKQVKLIGQKAAIGFSLRSEAILQTLTLDVLKSNEIEGEILDHDQVRSSIAHRLGIETFGMVPADRQVEGVVDMLVDATQQFDQSLTKDRLFGWHAALFPIGRSGMHTITVADWRNSDAGPMQVVSGPVGREQVHFQAPDSARLEADMHRFLEWFNNENSSDPVIKAAIAHL